MGQVTATISLTNHIDEILAERGFIPPEQIRSIILNDVIVDTGASDLCLPEEVISELGLPLAGEIEGNTASETKNFRMFKDVTLVVEGRERTFNCIELPAGKEPLLGYFPLEALGLEPDLTKQQLRVLPNKGRQSYIRV